MQGLFDNIIYYINKSKEKNHVIIAVNTEEKKTCDKRKYPVIIFKKSDLGNREDFLDVAKCISKKCRTNVFLDGGMLKAFLLN